MRRFFIFTTGGVIAILFILAPSSAFAFSPSDISGLQIQLDATTGVYQDSGKTTPASYYVLNWADQSGNSRDATTTSISTSPNLTTTATSSIYFSSSHYFQANWGTLTGNAARTIVVVFSKPSTSNGTLISWGANSSNQLSQIGVYSGAIGYTGYANDLTTSVTPYADGKLHVLIVSFDGTTMNLYIDGVSKGTASKTLNSGVSPLAIGNAITHADPFTGSISEVLIYNQGISSTDASNLYSYLDAKFGNTSISAPTLPAIPTSPAPSDIAKPVQVILDQDIATDQGDVGALAELMGLQQLNEANVLAVVTNSDNDSSAPLVKTILNWYGYSTSTIPVGAFQGTLAGGSSYSHNGTWPDQIVSLFGTSGDTRANYPSATDVYRQTLASAADDSVVIICIGFQNNLEALLESSADGYSSLTGTQLVTQKVKRLVVMGGDYPSSSSAEWNFAGDPAAASYVMANWPTEIVATGYSQNGGTVGPSSSRNGSTDPVKKAYDLKGATTRAWDQLGVLYGVRGLTTGLTIGGVSGKNYVDPSTGTNFVLYESGGLFNYLGYSSATTTLDTNIKALMDNLPITVSSIQASSTIPTAATITWTTSTSTESQVQYGLTSSYTASTTLDSTLTTSHSVTISGLSPGATYHYSVLSTGGFLSSSAISSDQIFTTPFIPTVTDNGSPSGTLTAGTTQATLAVSTDENAQCKYDTTANTTFSLMANTFTTTGTTTPTTSHSTTVSGLSNGNSYTYYVRCADTYNNATTTDLTISFSIASPPSTTHSSSGGGWTAPPPTAPAGGFAATAAASATAGKQTLSFNFGSDVTKIVIADNTAFVPASYINATSTIEWPNSDTGTLYVKFCNQYSKCSNPIAIPTPTAAQQPNTPTYSYTRNLTTGDTGADVTALQQFLIAGGYTIPAGATGYFGSQTQTALAAYQKANSINPPAGYFGPLTRANIASAAVPTSTTQTDSAASTTAYQFSRNLQLNDTGEDVRQLQMYLNTHGFMIATSGAGSPGHETDYFGSATYAALVQFQNAHASDILAPVSLTQGTGYLGESTRAYMNSH